MTRATRKFIIWATGCEQTLNFLAFILDAEKFTMWRKASRFFLKFQNFVSPEFQRNFINFVFVWFFVEQLSVNLLY